MKDSQKTKIGGGKKPSSEAIVSENMFTILKPNISETLLYPQEEYEAFGELLDCIILSNLTSNKKTEYFDKTMRCYKLDVKLITIFREKLSLLFDTIKTT